MLKRVSRHPLLATLTQQATKALVTLHQEITQREQELTTLKAAAARWQSVGRGPARVASPTVTPPRVPPPTRSQLDWSALLKGLPTRFTAQDVAQKARKPIEQVYVHVSRWRKDKQVQRVQDGYQKVS